MRSRLPSLPVSLDILEANIPHSMIGGDSGEVAKNRGKDTSCTRLWVGLGAPRLGLLAVLLAVLLLRPKPEAGL